MRAESVEEFTAARGVFLMAVGGRAETAGAIGRFEKLTAAPSLNAPLYLAYLGAARTLEGRDAWMPWNKMRYTERGLDTVEKALRALEPQHDRILLAGSPLSMELRLVAATSFLAVPDIFKRGDLGRKVLREAFASPAYANAPVEIRARLLRQAALAAGKDGKPAEEMANLRRMLEIMPAGPLAQEAQRRLRELKS